MGEGDNGNRIVKVRWAYDEDETSEIPESSIREKSKGENQKDGELEAKTLAIFGPERMRKLTELRVMATIETKCPGTFPSSALVVDGDTFGVEISQLSAEEKQNCPERRRKAIGAAAQCIAEQVGEHICIAGSKAERARGNDYLQWLSKNKPSVPDVETRDDVDFLTIAKEKCSNLPEHVITQVDEETGTVAFFSVGEQLVICGHDAAKRKAALNKFLVLQDQKPAPKRDEMIGMMTIGVEATGVGRRMPLRRRGRLCMLSIRLRRSGGASAQHDLAHPHLLSSHS